MAKARMIARSISIDKELNELSIKSQLIYTWCIPFLDDFGLLTNDIGNIKYLVFPRNTQIEERDIEIFLAEATKLIEILDDCVFFKGFTKNNIITEYKKARSEFKENNYNKGKSKYSPVIPSNPQENSNEDKIRKDKINNNTAKAEYKYFYKEKNMDTIYLDELGEPIQGDPIPKKYTNKKRLYSKIGVYYMELLGKRGNVLRYFPAIKEILEIYEKDFPNDTEEEIEKEIKARIDISNKFYNSINCTDWGLGKLAENWDKINSWKSKLK